MNSPLRHDLISTSVTFLRDPRVSNHSLEQKEEFLRKKGLNQDEIDLAVNIASSQPDISLPSQVPRSFISPANDQMYSPINHLNSGLVFPSGLQMVQSLVPPLVLAYGTIYGIYYLYKKYIEPYLFGPPAKHPLYLIIDSVNKLNKSVETIKESLVQMEDNIVEKLKSHMKEFNQVSAQERLAAVELKKELTSLKALLLGRNNFPETPSINGKKCKSEVSPNGITASIPSWQLPVEGENY